MRRSGRSGGSSMEIRARCTRCLALAFLIAALAPMQVPGVALADDATVSTCTEPGFDAALLAVQSSGGGTITFDCSGTIEFSSEKTISTNVTIIGNGGVVFDGDDSTRLFQVNSGRTLNLVALTLQNGNSSKVGRSSTTVAC